MNTTTWNPHRYIEYFGSKEKLQRVAALNDKAFHKAILSKRINEAVKSYLDKTANFCLLNRFPNLDDYIEKGRDKDVLMKIYKCGPSTLNEELIKRYGTIVVSSAMEKVKRERLNVFDLSGVDKELIFAIKNHKTSQNIADHLFISQSGLRHRLDNSFNKTSNLTIIRSMIEDHEKKFGPLI